MAIHQAVAPKMAEQAATPEVEQFEPWLPAEQKMVVTSLVLGVTLLLILIVVSYAVFPAVR